MNIWELMALGEAIKAGDVEPISQEEYEAEVEAVNVKIRDYNRCRPPGVQGIPEQTPFRPFTGAELRWAEDV